MAITNTTSTVQAIFSLHVVTAGCAFLLLLAAIAMLARQLVGGPGRPRSFMKFTRSTDKRHSSMFTHLFLASALSTLLIAYAAQSAIVALQSRINSPFFITSAYSYPSYTVPTGTSSPSYGKYISILSFLYQCAMILLNASMVGAIWIYANHVQNNGTGIKEPGFLSWVWNAFWMVAICALGFASWGLGLKRRGSGNTALAYPSLVSYDYIVRTLFVTYLAVVIAASTSVTLEAFLCWLGVKKNGVVGNKSKKALAAFTFTVTPLVWARNAFYIAQIVIIYRDETRWSRTTNQALAFLFIIFTELADLGILALLLLGTGAFGGKDKRRGDGLEKEGRYSESGREYVDGPAVEPAYVVEPEYVPHVDGRASTVRA